jgi:hypothetical protein
MIHEYDVLVFTVHIADRFLELEAQTHMTPMSPAPE